jgi:hypothetical protein
MRTHRLMTILPALLLALAAQAQSVPDFSGTWVLNPGKGQNLGMVAAIQETLEVSQDTTTLVVKHTAVFQGRASERTVTYDLTGEPMTNEQAMGEVSETITSVVGDELMTTWTTEGAIAGTTSTRTETRALTDGGLAMTVTTVRGDNPPMVMVYEKR